MEDVDGDAFELKVVTGTEDLKELEQCVTVSIQKDVND